MKRKKNRALRCLDKEMDAISQKKLFLKEKKEIANDDQRALPTFLKQKILESFFKVKIGGRLVLKIWCCPSQIETQKWQRAAWPDLIWLRLLHNQNTQVWPHWSRQTMSGPDCHSD